jgi:hypothetical protein
LPPDCLAVYNFLKSALVSEPIVDYPSKNRPYSLIVDASAGTVGVAGGPKPHLQPTNSPPTQVNDPQSSPIIDMTCRCLLSHLPHLMLPILLKIQVNHQNQALSGVNRLLGGLEMTY